MASNGSQSTSLFGDDPDGFEDTLREIDLNMKDSTTSAPSVSSPPAKLIPQKRRYEQLSQPELEPQSTSNEVNEQRENGDVDIHALASIRQRNDPTDIYGASSFGGYGEYMSRKRAKLQIQNAEMTEARSNIFKGVEIYVNGKTEPSLQVLREMIVANGGVFHAYMTKKSLVTHIIATNVTNAKVKEYQNMKVVRPEWIVESVKSGVLLPWRNFKLEIEERGDIAQGAQTAQAKLQFNPASPTKPAIRSSLKEEDRPSSISNPQEKLILSEQEIQDPIYMTDPVTLEQAARIPSYALNKTNHAAVRLMAREGWKEENTAASGEKFINSYYQNSRLHHLSMWKAELKDLISTIYDEKFEKTEKSDGENPGLSADGPTALQNLSEGSAQMGHGVSMKGADLMKSWQVLSPGKKGKAREQPSISLEKVYMHCDFDCFFVSASLLARPEMKGKPAVVCHSTGSGEGIASTSEIASCSYEAREFGIKNGMSLGQARQLCPEIVTLPYEFERYKELSLKFYSTLVCFADEIQAVSVDEALLDVSRAVANLKAQTLEDVFLAEDVDFGVKLAEQIRAQLLETTSCQVSIGIAENLMLARIATRKAKPAGIYHLRTADAPGFLAQFPLDIIWGVGYANKKKAEEKLGIKTIGDLRTHSKGSLVRVFGPSMGDKLYKAARGIDDTKLQPEQKRKSVSAEINFGIRFTSNEQAEFFMRKLAAEVSSRLKAIDMKGRMLTLKILKRHPDAPVEAPKFMGHGICETFSKSTPIADTTGGSTSDPDILGDASWNLLDSFGFDPTELRGLGLQVTKLEGKDGPNPTSPGPKLKDGQRRLQFKPSPKTGTTKRSSESDGASTSPPATTSTSMAAQTTKTVEIGDPGDEGLGVKRSPPSYDDISEATVDPEVLEALPSDIREEILAQMKRGGVSAIPTEGIYDGPPGPAVNVPSTSAVKLDEPLNKTAIVSTATSTAVVPVQEIEDDPEIVIVEPPPRDSEPLSTSKSREKGKKREVDYKTPKTDHIARQLQPKTKLIVSPTKNPLFTKRAKVQVTNAELEQLDIDPEVFFQLPPDLQREQLTNAKNERQRQSSRAGFGFGSGLRGRGQFQSDPDNGIGIWHKGGPLKNAFHSRFSRSPSVMPPPPSDVKFVAAYPEKLAITLPGTGGGTSTGTGSDSSLTLTDMADIQTHIKRWVMACQKKGTGPCSKDVEGIKDWLVRCMAQEGTESGMEKAVIVARWWRSLLRTYWASEENQNQKGKKKPFSKPGQRTSANVETTTSANDKVKMKAMADEKQHDTAKAETEAEEVEDLSTISPGVAWWAAFHSCKLAMDEESKKRFGGKVSL